MYLKKITFYHQCDVKIWCDNMSKFFEKNIVSQKLLGLGIGYGIVIWHIELKIPKYTGCFIE